MDNHEDQLEFREPRHHIKMWFALLAGPMAWMIGLVGKYAAVPFSCGSTSSLGLHAISAATLVVSLAGLLLAWQLWQQSGKHWPDERATPVVRTRFMAAMSLLAGGLFALAIIAQWITSAFLNPCMAI